MKLTEGKIAFLRDLMRWGGIASPQDLGPQTSQYENSARQRCKANGLVTFERSEGYWRITPAGRAALEQSESQP